MADGENQILFSAKGPKQTCVEENIFKLNFVSCTTSLIKLGSFLDSKEHDFIRI